MTIGQLAKHANVTVKAIRVYHARGLLPEPVRGQSGYRRYDVQAIVDLARITTLAKAGVRLADIPAILGLRGGKQSDETLLVGACNWSWPTLTSASMI